MTSLGRGSMPANYVDAKPRAKRVAKPMAPKPPVKVKRPKKP